MRRQQVWLIVIILLLVGIAGCSNQVSSGEATPVPTHPPLSPDLPVPDTKVTLEVWLDLDFTRDNTLFREIADEFERVYSQTYQRELTINIQSFVGESIPEKVRQAIQSGTPPDIAQGHVYSLAWRGLAEPLNSEWQAWGPEAEAQFLPRAMDEVTWQNSRYGIPVDIYTMVLLYNRNHFDEAGLPYPSADYTPQDLQEAIIRLTRPEEERYGIALSTDPRYVFTWIAGVGGELVTQDATGEYTVVLNSQNVVNVVSFLTGLTAEGYASLPTSRPRDYEDARELFLAGKASLYIGGPWDIHLIQSAYPDFPLGVAQLPRTPAAESAASVLGVSGLFVPRRAQHKEIAFELMKWFVDDRYSTEMARRTGRYPAKVWLQTTPDFSENLLLRPFFNQLNAARPYRLDMFPRAEEAFTNAVKAAFYGVPAAEALDEAQRIYQTEPPPALLGLP
ncbi:MAG: sugar ABC transporter substrate-binding protein [Chloroflexi bacterium]|nr:MAG: sugar ABC transporter substrate-binding protein [Chloroflexota bacterium]